MHYKLSESAAITTLCRAYVSPSCETAKYRQKPAQIADNLQMNYLLYELAIRFKR